VPVLDAGQDAQSDRYFLVMPLCARSLQREIETTSEDLRFNNLTSAVPAIIAGLQEVPDITHRDLKPANVLFHDGSWKIADFGIAKFVEDSTSLETLRTALTPAYAAPEQWNGERPTSATDVYALGCIVNAIMTGHPPFVGSVDQMREGHLLKRPPSIETLPANIAAFVAQMLRKVPLARPTLKRCAQVFNEIPLETKKASSSYTALHAAAKHVATLEADAEAKRLEAKQRNRERKALFNDASTILKGIYQRLLDEIRRSAETVRLDKAGLKFGAARMVLDPEPQWYDGFNKETRVTGHRVEEVIVRSPWEIVSWSIIKVSSDYSRQSYTWSASLLFADKKDGSGYRWYEIGFFQFAGKQNLYSGSDHESAPFGLAANDRDLILALGSGMHSVGVAYGPFPIDGEDEGRFLERWIDLVARAAVGELRPPDMLPITNFN